MKTPMVCSADTFPKVPISLKYPKMKLTAWFGKLTPNPENVWGIILPKRCLIIGLTVALRARIQVLFWEIKKFFNIIAGLLETFQIRTTFLRPLFVSAF